jgi:peptidoglycan/xylan/chitin deacetylase (PgdA/CDA1 family)
VSGSGVKGVHFVPTDFESRTCNPTFELSTFNSVRYKNPVATYYHSLAPFRELFQTGLPALMYHKLGPRPHGVRLKGLYVAEKLFARQLAELREAGFVTLSLDEAFPMIKHPAPAILLTFDDGFVNALRYGLPLLDQFRFRAVQYLVADRLGGVNEWDRPKGEVMEPLMDDAQIRDWLAAGHEIGSHTCTHPFLTQLAPAQAREEISASRKKLEDKFGRPVEHFCYPYGDCNEAIHDLVAAAGYKTAFTTEEGVNTPADSPFALKRYMARYPSRNLKSLWSRAHAP